MSTKIVVSKNPEELGKKAAEDFVRIARHSIEEKQRFTIALSGGSTPRALHAKLIDADLDWSRVDFFFGDERNVPPDHADSNFRMASETLLKPLGIAEERIHRWKTELLVLNEIADDYEADIRDHVYVDTNGLPRFDLIILGMGSDGHTASLFPHTEALKEKDRFAVENWVEKLDSWRFTMTFPVINNAANITFLVAGKDKARTLIEVIQGARRPRELPAQSIQPTNGEMFWYADEAAASLLRNVDVYA